MHPVYDEFMDMKIFKGIATKPLAHPSRPDLERYLQLNGPSYINK